MQGAVLADVHNIRTPRRARSLNICALTAITRRHARFTFASQDTRLLLCHHSGVLPFALGVRLTLGISIHVESLAFLQVARRGWPRPMARLSSVRITPRCNMQVLSEKLLPALPFSAPTVQESKSRSNRSSPGPGPPTAMHPGRRHASFSLPCYILIVAHDFCCSDLTPSESHGSGLRSLQE